MRTRKLDARLRSRVFIRGRFGICRQFSFDDSADVQSFGFRGLVNKAVPLILKVCIRGMDNRGILPGTMRAPLPDLDALEIEALKALVLSQHEEKQRQAEELDRQRAALNQQRTQYGDELRERSEQIEHLRLVVEKLRRMLFGRKSEKLSIQLDQLELQREEMEAIHAVLASVPVCNAQTDNTGAKPARKPLPEHLPRQINGKTKTGRLWTYVRDDRPAGDNTAPAVWFAYSPDRKGEHPREHLKAFAVTLQADAYSGFHHLYDTGRIREAACWAHARRKFHDIHAARPSPTITGALDD